MSLTKAQKAKARKAAAAAKKEAADRKQLATTIQSVAKLLAGANLMPLLASVPRTGKTNKKAEDLMDDLRDNIVKGLDNALQYAEDLVGQSDSLSTKTMATKTIDFLLKGGALTVDSYRQAYWLMFPKTR